MTRPLDVIDRWWSTFEENNLDDLLAMVADDVEVLMPGGMVLRGAGELRPMLEGYLAAFPGLRHQVVSSVETTDSIAVELRITMRHTGPFATPAGEIAPTGNTVVLDACDVVRLGPDGRIISWHAYFDQASMMAQITTSPAGASA